MKTRFYLSLNISDKRRLENGIFFVRQMMENTGNGVKYILNGNSSFLIYLQNKFHL